MLLNMYIGNELIDSVTVFPSSGNKVYVDQFKSQLLQRHAERLEAEKLSPVFILEGVPSRLNKVLTSPEEKFDKFKNDNLLYLNSIQHKE